MYNFSHRVTSVKPSISVAIRIPPGELSIVINDNGASRAYVEFERNSAPSKASAMSEFFAYSGPIIERFTENGFGF